MPNNKNLASFPRLEPLPSAFNALQNPPKDIFYSGDVSLLDNPHKIAIVGTRKPNPYTKSFVAILASRIRQLGGIVVSGGALGVDIIAHTNAMPSTIMISPSSLETPYPQTNASAIKEMMSKSLVLSEYERDFIPLKHSFLERNRLVVALSECVIIPQADIYSGSMSSAAWARKLNKPLFVLPHRIGESEGTNALLQEGRANAIYVIDAFLEGIFGKIDKNADEILRFCALAPSFEEALNKFGDRIYEYELEGKIIREGNIIRTP